MNKMRVEINLVLFMKNKSYKKIDGFLSVADSREDNKELMDAMCDFIDDVTEDYMDAFTSGLAQIVTGRNNVHYVSFKNPNLKSKDAKQWNLIIPESTMVQ
jgi:hypothetical protein